MVAITSAMFFVWSAIRLEIWATGPETHDASTSTIPWTEVNPVGFNTFLNREVEPWKRNLTLEMAGDANAGWIKEHFPWRSIETSQDVYWDFNFQQDAWAKYDAIVDNAEQHGLRIIARIDLAPAWARPVGSSPTAPPEDIADYAEFIAEFVRRYQGRVQFIQVWNEPNLAAEWGGSIDPEGYARLLDAAATAARAVDPNVVILSAPMAMTTENSERAMDDLRYWQALYDAGVSPSFDIMAANAYGLNQRFDAPPDKSELNIRRVELLRELAVRNGDTNKPGLVDRIWVERVSGIISARGFALVAGYRISTGGLDGQGHRVSAHGVRLDGRRQYLVSPASWRHWVGPERLLFSHRRYRIHATGALLDG